MASTAGAMLPLGFSVFATSLLRWSGERCA